MYQTCISLILIQELYYTVLSFCSSHELSTDVIFFLHQSANAHICFCVYISAALGSVLCVSYLPRIKQRLSAVIDNQCFITLIDSMILFVNGALDVVSSQHSCRA